MQIRNICFVPGCDSKLSNKKNISIQHFPQTSIVKWLSSIKKEFLANVTFYRDITSQRMVLFVICFCNSRRDGTIIFYPSVGRFTNIETNNFIMKEIRHSSLHLKIVSHTCCYSLFREIVYPCFENQSPHN